LSPVPTISGIMADGICQLADTLISAGDYRGWLRSLVADIGGRRRGTPAFMAPEKGTPEQVPCDYCRNSVF
jgi:hypothetical protein